MILWSIYGGSAAAVKRFYDKILAVGRVDEGEPAIRSGRFSAYVRDIDKNKICIFEWLPPTTFRHAVSYVLFYLT